MSRELIKQHPRKRPFAGVPSARPKKLTPEDMEMAAFFARMDAVFNEMLKALPGIQAAAGDDPKKLRAGLEQWKRWYLAQHGGAGGNS